MESALTLNASVCVAPGIVANVVNVSEPKFAAVAVRATREGFPLAISTWRFPVDEVPNPRFGLSLAHKI